MVPNSTSISEVGKLGICHW